MLEDFHPARIEDKFRWIPQGLYLDLNDAMNDNFAPIFRVPLNDDVSGYTCQQFFNALDADITSLQNYKTRLLSENGNNQATGVNNIFSFYGY